MENNNPKNPAIYTTPFLNGINDEPNNIKLYEKTGRYWAKRPI